MFIIKAYFFDVDGTLTPQRKTSYANFKREFLPNVREKVTKLVNSGCIIVLVSNQGGARRNRSDGRVTIGTVHAHLKWVMRELKASAYYFAITGRRKKPSPSMLQEAASQFNLQHTDVVFIGDAETDRKAAEAFGCKFEYAETFFK